MDAAQIQHTPGGNAEEASLQLLARVWRWVQPLVLEQEQEQGQGQGQGQEHEQAQAQVLELVLALELPSYG